MPALTISPTFIASAQIRSDRNRTESDDLPPPDSDALSGADPTHRPAPVSTFSGTAPPARKHPTPRHSVPFLEVAQRPPVHHFTALVHVFAAPILPSFSTLRCDAWSSRPQRGWDRLPLILLTCGGEGASVVITVRSPFHGRDIFVQRTSGGMLYRLTTAQRSSLTPSSFVMQPPSAPPVFARSEVEGGRSGSLSNS